MLGRGCSVPRTEKGACVVRRQVVPCVRWDSCANHEIALGPASRLTVEIVRCVDLCRDRAERGRLQTGPAEGLVDIIDGGNIYMTYKFDSKVKFGSRVKDKSVLMSG